MGCASSKDAAAVLPTAPTDGSPSKSRSTSPRQNADGLTAKTLKSAARSGADVLKLVPARVPGDLSAWASGLRDDRGRPEAMRFLGELSQARNDGIDIERASATWSTSSFTSYHGQLALAGRAVGGRDRDRAGDQEERALLLKSYRVRRGAL